MFNCLKLVTVSVVMRFCLISAMEPGQIRIGRLMLEKSERDFDKEFFTLNVTFSNDSTNTLVNFEVELLQDLLGTTTLSSEINNFIGGKYKSLIKTAEIDVCEFFKNRNSYQMITMVYDELLLKGNFPKACPVLKDKYYVKDFAVNANMLPPYMPSGKYRTDITVHNELDGIKKKILAAKHFITIA